MDINNKIKAKEETRKSKEFEIARLQELRREKDQEIKKKEDKFKNSKGKISNWKNSEKFSIKKYRKIKQELVLKKKTSRNTKMTYLNLTKD